MNRKKLWWSYQMSCFLTHKSNSLMWSVTAPFSVLCFNNQLKTYSGTDEIFKTFVGLISVLVRPEQIYSKRLAHLLLWNNFVNGTRCRKIKIKWWISCLKIPKIEADMTSQSSPGAREWRASSAVYSAHWTPPHTASEMRTPVVMCFLDGINEPITVKCNLLVKFIGNFLTRRW